MIPSCGRLDLRKKREEKVSSPNLCLSDPYLNYVRGTLESLPLCDHQPSDMRREIQ